jgi:hypothetical protein
MEKGKINSFSVYTFTSSGDSKEKMYTHWSNGLSMFITKNGVTIELDPDEIKQIVKSLPRTIGGSY